MKKAVLFSVLILLSIMGYSQQVVTSVGLSYTQDVLNPKTYGAKGDAKLLTNAAVTAGSVVLTCATASFTSADIGKKIAIPYAGAGATVGQTHLTTIASINSATSINMTDAAVKTILVSRTVTDAGITLNNLTLTSATAAFTAGDIGKRIMIPGAGLLLGAGLGSPDTCYIATIVSGTQVTVTRKALATVSSQTVTIPGATVIYGTDDGVALQRAFDSASSKKKQLVLDAKYLITTTLTPKSDLNVKGTGRGSAILYPVGTGSLSAITRNSGSTSSPLSDIVFENFEIDGIGVTCSAYASINKGIYILYVYRPVFRNLYIHNTSATGLGCDHLKFYVMENIVAEHCGRQVFEFGGGAGGSGFGVGTGMWTEEPGVITNCHAIENGNNGIFVESQSSNIMSRGIRIIGNYAAWNGGPGISDRATDGTVINGNISEYNGTGILLTLGFVAGLYSKNTIISNNIIRFNNGGQIIANMKNESLYILNNTTDAGSGVGAIEVSDVTGGTIKELVIKGNTINGFGGKGIKINSGTFRNITIQGNTVVDCGISTVLRRAGIELSSTVTRLYVKDNIVYDSRALASKFTSYGLALNSGTYSKLEVADNDFADTQDGEVDFSGATITNLIYPTKTYVAKTANYTATLTDNLIEATANSFTITLPTAVGIKQKEYIIKNTGAGTITMAFFGSETGDGATSPTIAAGASVIWRSNNANWIKVN